MTRKNVYYFLSNRCSYARSKVLLEKLNEAFNLSVIITGGIMLEGFEKIKEEIQNKYHTIPIRIDIPTNTLDLMAQYSAELAVKAADIFTKRKPDCLMLWADRFELLPVAMVANYMGIPIAHLQGGETTGNIDNYVRNAVSMLSQCHFASHIEAGKKLVSMGRTNVHDTGCPAIDLIKEVDFEEPTHDYIICIWHPHTDEIDKISDQTELVFKKVIEFCDKHNLSLYWFKSNNDPGHLLVNESLSNITVINNLDGEKFIKLLAGSKMIVGNSSAGIRESSFLAIPSVVIGDRQKERLTAPNAIRCDFDDLEKAMELVYKMKPKPSKLFGDGKASQRIVKILKGWMNG